MIRSLAIATVAALFLAAAPLSWADDAKKPAKPVDIESDQMEIKDKEKQAIFTGNVDANVPLRFLAPVRSSRFTRPDRNASIRYTICNAEVEWLRRRWSYISEAPHSFRRVFHC